MVPEEGRKRHNLCPLERSVLLQFSFKETLLSTRLLKDRERARGVRSEDAFLLGTPFPSRAMMMSKIDDGAPEKCRYADCNYVTCC